jgi:hypothetical protein
LNLQSYTHLLLAAFSLPPSQLFCFCSSNYVLFFVLDFLRRSLIFGLSLSRDRSLCASGSSLLAGLLLTVLVLLALLVRMVAGAGLLGDVGVLCGGLGGRRLGGLLALG